jgi:PAS domain S-box-containing protein
MATLASHDERCSVQKRYWWFPLVALLPIAVSFGVFVSHTRIERDYADAIAAREDRDLLVNALSRFDRPVMIAGENGVIRYANIKASKLTGYSRDELIGMASSALVPVEMRSEHTVGLSKATRSHNRTKSRVDCELLLADGTTSQVEVYEQSMKVNDATWIVVEITHREVAP